MLTTMSFLLLLFDLTACLKSILSWLGCHVVSRAWEIRRSILIWCYRIDVCVWDLGSLFHLFFLFELSLDLLGYVITSYPNPFLFCCMGKSVRVRLGLHCFLFAFRKSRKGPIPLSSLDKQMGPNIMMIEEVQEGIRRLPYFMHF